MKEERYFYVPDISTATADGALSGAEANHAARVLRLKAGDEIMLIDGRGSFYRAQLTLVSNHQCCYSVLETLPQELEWQGHIHLAMAPTKMMERVEWFAEKATEIGVNELSFLNCRLSGRRQMRADRIEGKVLSAVKQSRKAWMPKVNDITDFKDFILAHDGTGDRNLSRADRGEFAVPGPVLRCIAHCYDDIPRQELFPLLQTPEYNRNILVLIGPEGDFHHDEVLFALDHGFQSISLGASRLRTETAALAAVMTARLMG